MVLRLWLFARNSRGNRKENASDGMGTGDMPNLDLIPRRLLAEINHTLLSEKDRNA